MTQPTSPLQELAALRGIEPHYVDVDGAVHETRDSTRLAILAALGIDARTPAAAAAAIERERRREHERLVPVISVFRGAGRARLAVRVPAPASALLPGRLLLRLRAESGALHVASCEQAALSESARVDSSAVTRTTWLVELPPLMLGYYDVEAVWCGERHEVSSGLLIVAPTQAYLPASIAAGRPLVGLSVNLYSLRTDDDFGIGSLAGAAQLAAWAARTFDAQCLGLPPLHAVPNRGPHDHSPYCPITRAHYNSIYLEVASLPEVADSPRAQLLLESSALRAEIAELRASATVRYEAVAGVQRRILDAAFRDFAERDVPLRTARARAFDLWRSSRGEELQRFALFEAIREHYSQQTPPLFHWKDWPAELRSPERALTSPIARELAGRILFHAFVQWCVERQLADAQRVAREAGMEIGLYHDLAVGSAASGYDAWAHSNLYVSGAEVGAPPDAFQKNGQMWGVLPLDPVALREARYEPWIELLRAALRHGGALRIDHVMGLFRLWWVPRGASATEGAYVRYPAEELLAILALESLRHRAMLVGEDLGTVPPGVRERLAEERIFGCRVVMFERDGEGRWTTPESYAPLSVASWGTHDLPTLAGFWLGRDLELRRRLQQFRSSKEAEEAPVARVRERLRMLEALEREGCEAAGLEAAIPSRADLPMVIRGFHRWLRQTRSRLQLVSLDDLLGVEEQRNAPGTLSEYPNWCGRLPQPLSEWTRSAYAGDVIASITGAVSRAEK
ncbi:MAG: 4-alpha-glucanotransferase [Planctomycetes bacterium]|nr:4-alpha-glucanotransferase [Planctomycetota bacterium]